MYAAGRIGRPNAFGDLGEWMYDMVLANIEETIDSAARIVREQDSRDGDLTRLRNTLSAALGMTQTLLEASECGR
jgi:hypothetical protein